MSFTIPIAHVQAFSRDVLVTAQQKGSKLSRTVMREQVTGESANFERIGDVELVERAGRHVDTPLISSPHSRRRLHIKDFELADLVDKQDRLKVIISPDSDYARIFGFAAGRKMDSQILSRLNGTAADDQDAAVAFDAGNSPSLDLGGAAAVSLQLIIDALTKMYENDVDEGESKHIAVDGAALRQLMGQAGTTANLPHMASADYAAIQAIQRGTIQSFAGFNWHIVSPAVMPKVAGSTTDRYIMFWSEFGGKVGMQQEPTVRIDERVDKSYSTQVYISTSFDVVRMDEKRVGRIRFDSTAAPL